MTATSIRPGCRVTLHYRLTSYGQDIADTFADAPETFLLGQGDIDPRLERHLQGLLAGERRLFQLHPWEAFGERDEALVRRLARAEFPADAELPVGHQVEFSLPNGDAWLGTVLAVTDTEVEVDFNHPLAGLPVEFEVSIIAVESAAEP